MIKFISFAKDILETALAEISGEDNLLLFPTHQSRKEAERLYQQKWNFTRTEFLTMEEFKDSLFPSSSPILREEKRIMAFYLALDQESKDQFQIENYFQAIELAYNFFGFWEEIAEEMIADEDIADLLSQKLSARNWQQKSFRSLQKIKENYYELLQKKGFNDQIFCRNIAKIKSKNNYKKIIVVNQFYFTKLEKAIIEMMKEKVIILSQIPKTCFDENELKPLNSFSAKDIQAFVPKKIFQYTAQKPLQMIAQMLNVLPENKFQTVIDFKFDEQSYAQLLSPEHFDKPQKIKFSQTKFYRFFQSIAELLKSRKLDGKGFLLSLQKLLEFALCDDLLEYFVSSAAEREKFRAQLFEWKDNDLQFIDEKLISQNNDLAQQIGSIFFYLRDFLKINDLEDLRKFLLEKTKITSLFSIEKTKTNIEETFFQAFSDFLSIAEIGIVQDWKQIFPKNTALSILQLLLSYLKAKKISYQIPKKKKFITITNLQNTRNLSFQNIFILNLIEGVLPDRKHTQFLFSENQRKELGLKSYEDITLRDKYYFYRLLTASEQAFLFTLSDLEENIEISSFLEELKLQGLVQEISAADPYAHHELFTQLFGNNRNFVQPKKNLENDFFSFPFRQEDFEKNKISLTAYKWQKLEYDPFNFYLEYIHNLRQRKINESCDLTAKLLGNIAHKIFEKIWQRIIKVHKNNSFRHNFIYNTKLYVQQAVEKYIDHEFEEKYYFPNDFSDNYFRHIFLEILKDGIENFFYRLHNYLKLSDKMITVLPEVSNQEEREYFALENFSIFLRGRADLRIETDKIFIFDFKTGSANYKKIKKYREQLQFYEMIYYLKDSPELENKLESYIFFIEQKQLETAKHNKDLKQTMIDVLQNILAKGFSIAQKEAEFEDLDLTRRDLN